MSAANQIIEPEVTGTVGFERKVNIPVDGYGTEHMTVSVYLPFTVVLDDPVATMENLDATFARAKEQVLIEAGREYEFDAEGRVMEQLREAFQEPLTAAPASSPAAQPRQSNSGGGGDRQVGSYTIRRCIEEPLPDWLEGELQAKGVPEGSEVWDNRRYLPQFGGKGNAKAPWFKQKGGDGIAVWPPK